MNVTKDGFKDRQLHMEDYLQMVSAELKSVVVKLFCNTFGSEEIDISRFLPSCNLCCFGIYLRN